MRQFLAFVLKEFRHIFRDRWTTLVLFLLPIVMLILFGFAITTEVKNTSLAIYDPANDQVTRDLAGRFAGNEYFRLTRMLKSRDEIELAFQRGEVGLVLVLSDEFSTRLAAGSGAQLQLIADGTDPNTARTIVNYATGVIATWQQEQQLSPPPVQIATEVKLLYNPRMKGAFNFVPGVMGMILMLICAMMTSVSIAREKETGTMEVLLVSPIRPVKIILAKTVPYFVISVADLAIILLLSVYVLEVPIAGSLPCLVTLSLVYIFLSLAIGLLVSSVVSSQMVALLISGMAMMMPVIMLSGMLFPIDNMPLLLQGLAQVVPAKWYIAAVKKVMIKGLGFEAVTQELAILGFMAAALIVVSLKKHKVRLE